MNILKYLIVISLLLMLLPISGFTQEQHYTETITINKKGLSSWIKQTDACKYAVASARRKAVRQCEKSKVESGKNKGDKIWGKYIKPDKVDKPKFESCIECYETNSKNWRCTGRVTLQCDRVRIIEDVEADGVIKELYKGLIEKTKTGDNPCTKNSHSDDCRDYKQSTKAVGGEKG